MQNTSQFIIYNASAGSGKTFTLVKNYISDLLIRRRNFRNVLAITFTNKAVAEMKERIIETLRGISLLEIPPKYQGIFEQIKAQTNLSKEEIQKRSAAILKTILHNYAGFEISTIDSFTHHILQVFAKDLNIPTNFEVQIEAKDLLQEAVDAVIARAGEDKELTKALVNYALIKTDDDRSWDITRDLNEVATLILNENNFKPLDQLREKEMADFEAFAQQVKKQIKKNIEARQVAAQTFYELIESNGLTSSDFPVGLQNHFLAVAKGEWKNPSTAKWALYPDDNPPYNTGLPDSKKALIEPLRPQIKGLYSTMVSTYYEVEFYKHLRKTINATSLLSTIEKEVDKIKEERSLLLISEFNKKISTSIKDEPAPFIYERLGERFTSFYVDEFQDTSVLQWENLKPLVAESLASENGQLSLIGDPKQSIYRWRGGRAEQFMALAKDENPFFVKKQVKKLPTNYRSAKDIVEFNNQFFKFASQYLQTQAYRELFENAGQEAASKERGLVDIRFLETKNRPEEDELYPEEIYTILQDLTAQYPKDYPLYKDICILVRKKDFATVIANYLTERDIPIISSESLLVKNSAVVNFLINLIDFSLRPEDKNLKFELLSLLHKELEISVSEFEFMQSRLPYSGNAFFNTLEEKGIGFSLLKFEQLPLYEAVEYALRTFNLEGKVDAYVRFFLDFVYEYTQSQTGGLTGFIERWNLKKDKLTIVTPEGNNAVQIMTVHKAKGLEFPIVIYPYANTKVDDTTKDSIWVPLPEGALIPTLNVGAKNDLKYYGDAAKTEYLQLLAEKEMDEMNVLYVALTRPEQQLYILTKLEKPGSTTKEYPHTFGTWFMEYLKAEHIWEEDERHYTFGELRIPDLWEDTSETEDLYQDFISSSPSDHQISVVTKSGQYWDSEQQKAIEEGNLIHGLLKEVKTVKDVPLTFENAVLSGMIQNKDLEKYKTQIDKIVQHPGLKDYFNDGYDIYTEKEIIVNHEFKRLDRLCLKGKEAVIIDYKTGSYSPQHDQQIIAYAAAMSSFGYDIKKCLLVYIDDEVEVKEII